MWHYPGSTWSFDFTWWGDVVPIKSPTGFQHAIYDATVELKDLCKRGHGYQRLRGGVYRSPNQDEVKIQIDERYPYGITYKDALQIFEGIHEYAQVKGVNWWRETAFDIWQTKERRILASARISLNRHLPTQQDQLTSRR